MHCDSQLVLDAFWNIAIPFGVGKLESWGYPMVKKV